MDITRGLIYIHSQRMLHGDLKGVSFRSMHRSSVLPSPHVEVNILIDRTGRARPTVDFDLLTIMSDPSYQLSSGSQQPDGTFRWMSPEFFEPQEFGFETSY